MKLISPTGRIEREVGENGRRNTPLATHFTEASNGTEWKNAPFPGPIEYVN